MLSIAVCDDKAIYGMEEETREAREKAELKREEAIQKRKEEREKSEERIVSVSAKWNIDWRIIE